MNRLRGILILLAGLAVASNGCDKPHAKPAAHSTTAPASLPAGSATIAGTVSLSGKAPVMATIPNQPCHDGAKPLTEETVVTDGAGRLANVVVYLENAPATGPASGLPAVVLDQVDCRYVPHVVALQTGQTLHVTTSDPTLHNVHGTSIENPAFNFALVAKGQARDLAFEAPESFPVRCDVHPWMKAYVRVFSHPWFAVTDKSGAFRIANVPAGTYTLVAWHEKYGTVRTSVTVGTGGAADASLAFQSGL